MKTDIIFSGVGGQGILSIAAVIGEAAVKNGLYMKQAEVHGMSQRGGDVQSHFRISDVPVASDLIAKGTADMIISLDPMEALRYLPYLKINRRNRIFTTLRPPDIPVFWQATRNIFTEESSYSRSTAYIRVNARRKLYARNGQKASIKISGSAIFTSSQNALTNMRMW